MPQPHPTRQILLPARQTKHVPQRPNLQLVEILIHRILHECLELQHALLNLQPRLLVHEASVRVGRGRAAFGCIAVCETEEGGVGGRQAGFERVGAAVEDFVYGVDYVVD